MKIGVCFNVLQEALQLLFLVYPDTIPLFKMLHVELYWFIDVIEFAIDFDKF